MLQITVNKKEISEATVMLAQVSALKSPGATPAENSCMNLTPTTMSLSNINEANAVLAENIPIVVTSGDIGPYCDKGFMLNTKKLAAIVKNSSKEMIFTVDEDRGHVLISSGRSSYTLEYYNTDKKPLHDVNLFNYTIQVKDILKTLQHTNGVTSRTSTVSYLSGTLFDKSDAYCTDKITGLYLKRSILFDAAPDTLKDVLISTDLFAQCLSKTEEETAMPGITPSGDRIALRFKNITLFKRIMADSFPKDKFLRALQSIKETATDKLVIATIKTKDLMDIIKETHGIVEADAYNLTFEQTEIRISNSNARVGAGGATAIDAKDVTIPPSVDKAIGGLFDISALLFIGEIFGESEEVTIKGSVGTYGGNVALGFIAIETEEAFYFAIPKPTN